MNVLLVIKEQLRRIYAAFGKYLAKAGQFLLALVVFWSISNCLGTMEPLNNPVVLVVCALVCMLLPLNSVVLVGAGMILAHLYKLSIEIMAVTAVLMLIMLILYFRFVPKQAFIVLIMPIACALKVPYAIPLCMGLTLSPFSALASACGLFVYYILHGVNGYAAAINTTEDSDIVSRLTYFIKQVIQNKEMILYMAVFAIVIIVVYAIRRLSIHYAWTIAILIGTIVNFVGFYMGSSILDVSIDSGNLIVGSLISVVIAMILQLFVFSVDYSRTQNVQFEDDEYYYYVKAVPKMSVSAPKKVVKHIQEEDE